MKKKTILVTGGAGYIGSHTSYLLAQQGYKVLILDTYIHGQTFDPQWATVIKKDCGDQKTLAAIFSEYAVDAVMHFAAFIEVGESVTFPQKFYDNNVVKTKTLLDAMIEHGVKRFIFSSSCAVYGNPVHMPMREDHPRAPVSPYGKTKLMIEYMLEDYAHAYGLEYVALRYFNAAGAIPEAGLGEQHKPETHVLPLMLRAACRQTLFSMFGNDYETKDGTCIRDYVHVQDIARAHVLSLEHLDRTHTSDCFNLGTGIGYSVKELVESVERITEKKMNIAMADRRPGDAPVLVAESSKAESILGWKPQFSELDFILQSAFQWEQARMQRD